MSYEIVGGLIVTKKNLTGNHVKFSLAHMTWCWQVIIFYCFSVISVTWCCFGPLVSFERKN
jgi:hypothetical protein